MMKFSYSVKTKIRKDKRKIDGTCPLYHQIIFNSQVLKLPISNISLKLEQWDEKSQSANRKFNFYKKLNRALSKSRERLEDFLYSCWVDEVVLTKKLVKEFYYGVDQKKNDFYHHFDQFYARKATEIRKGTLAHYALLRKQLKEFRSEITLTEVDYPFIDDFFHFLKTEKRVGPSGIAMRRKNLVTTFEYFIKKGLVESNPAKEYKKPKENIREEFLSLNEIKRIEELNLDIGNRSYGYNLSRDIFLFTCYTGLRFGDVVTLKTKHIKKNTIEKRMIKTNSLVKVPLVVKAQRILTKYIDKKDMQKNIFPFRSNVSINRDLKDIARWANIDQRVSHHTGRHTFGSNLAMQGVQPFYIMKVMGHRDVRMTERYVNSDVNALKEAFSEIVF